MKLAEAIFNLSELPDEAVLFAERIDGQLSPQSPVVILSLDDEELALPTAEVAASRAPGTDYFLEGFLVRDMVAEWRDTRTDLQNKGYTPFRFFCGGDSQEV